jgi:fructose-bisphosphate aldolase class II
MARITLRQLLDHAAEHAYGVPAFNINNMEQALAIMTAANAVDAPVIIQASRGARQYANDIMLKHMMDAVTEIYPHIPVCVHLDHGNEPATCMTAIQAGFTSVMMDGSLKADWQDAGGLGLQCPRHEDGDGHGASGRHFGRGRTRSTRLARERDGRGRGWARGRGPAQP